jgi:hypothetical protein
MLVSLSPPFFRAGLLLAADPKESAFPSVERRGRRKGRMAGISL